MLRVMLIRQQITQTLLQFPMVRAVRIAIEGQAEGALEPSIAAEARRAGAYTTFDRCCRFSRSPKAPRNHQRKIAASGAGSGICSGAAR